MSRAFVKELDGDQAEGDILEKPQSKYPNYMTLNGLAMMKRHYNSLCKKWKNLKAQEDSIVAKNQLNTIESEIIYLEKRIHCVIPVDLSIQSGEEIRFGATVSLIDEVGHNYKYTIVGEDEADPDRGLISWISPLAKEILNKRIGDVVLWQRSDDKLELEICSFKYNKD